MTLNELECPIHLKVRMSHGLLADSVDKSLASLLHVYTLCLKKACDAIYLSIIRILIARL